MDIRTAHAGDAETLATLLAAYLAERFPGHVGTSAAALERDVLSGAGGMRVLLADAHGQPAGFVAWHPTYDLHWGKSGAQIDRPRQQHKAATMRIGVSTSKGQGENKGNPGRSQFR